MRHPLVFLILFTLMISCAQQNKEVITNLSGGYSIEVLPDWDHTIENSNTSIMRSKSLIVEATLSVSTLESEYETLDESFNEYVAQLPSGFADYSSLGNGYTQINNTPAKWHRMKDTEAGKRYMTVIYVMQPIGKKMILISCSSLEETFANYEEDFTKMSFSLDRVD